MDKLDHAGMGLGVINIALGTYFLTNNYPIAGIIQLAAGALVLWSTLRRWGL